MKPLGYYNRSTHMLKHVLISRTGLPVTDAVVTATMVNDDGQPVAGQTWPLTLTHVSAGLYEGQVSHQLQVEHDDNIRYWMQVTAVRGLTQSYSEERVIIEIDRD